CHWETMATKSKQSLAHKSSTVVYDLSAIDKFPRFVGWISGEHLKEPEAIVLLCRWLLHSSRKRVAQQKPSPPKAAWLSGDFSTFGVILKSMGPWSFPLFSKTYLHAERAADPFELGTDCVGLRPISPSKTA